MAPVQFSKTKQSAKLADIQEIEKKYGFLLPDDYKAHVQRNNGGFPDQDAFMQLDEEDSTSFIVRRVNDFYAIGQGDNTLQEALESLHDQLHPDLVPFADDAGGDQFCLSVGPDDYGSVYYVAHEAYRPPAFLEEEDVAATPRDYGQGVYFLCPSFTAFLQGLIDKPVE